LIPEQQLCESELTGCGNIFLNMGRLPKTTAFLKQKEDEGAVVLNSGYGVEMCQRSRLEALMREKHIPMPRKTGTNGWWVKRGDAAAQCHQDVLFCKDDEALAKGLNIIDGKVVYKAVADVFGLPYERWQ
jgi:hypothetical protein